MTDMHMTGGEEAMLALYAQDSSSIVGGSTLQNPRVIGGLDDIKEYANSVMSKSKEKLIRDIARDMKSKFKVEGKGANKLDINPDADLKTVISQLKKAIPDPNTNGRVWSSKLGTQKSACKQMARIINERYGFTRGTGMIDENDEPENICEKVSEVMYTLFVGMHGEFLNVREDALRMAKNLHLLEGILQRNFEHLLTKMKNADPESIMAETKLARDGHQLILDELKRQQAMLNNTLNVVISPEDKDIAKLLKASKDFKHLVKKIKAMPGTGKFGEKVAFVLSGVGTTAQMAQVVDSALKKVSMSLSEYGQPKSVKDLEQAIFSKLQAKLSGSSAKELEEYIKAAKALFRYDYRRSEVVSHLSKKGGEEDEVRGGLKLDKRVKDRQDMKKALVGAFNKQLGNHLERINSSTEKLARGTGTTVPVTDALRQFTKRLELIPNIEKRNIFFALTGYYNDAASKEERGYFLDNVNLLCESLEKMLKMSEYSNNDHVKDLLRSWKGIVALVNDYSSRFDRGFGAISAKVAPSRSEYGTEDAITGSGPWWTAVKAGLEAAGVSDPAEQSKLYSGEDGEGGIKAELNALLKAGSLPWEKFTETVEELVMKATGKKVSIKDKALDQEIQETQERLAARDSPAESSDEESSDEADVVEPGDKPKPKKAKSGKKAPKKKSRKKGRGEDDEQFLGGDDIEGAEEDDITGGASTVAEISRLADNLNHSKDVMRYFFRAADIRRNMAYVSPELKEHGSNYEKVLGDAIAGARDSIMKDMNTDVGNLRAGKNANGGESALSIALKAVALTDKIPAGSEQERLYVDDRLKKIAEDKMKFYNCKINMVKCAEAMDLYMKHFTDGIVANIDDVQKVEVMLRGTEIISKWFSSRSGNLICSVFDTFPDKDGFHSNLNENWDNTADLRDLHYYWRVQAQCQLAPDITKVKSDVGNAMGVVTNPNNKVVSKTDVLKNYHEMFTDKKTGTDRTYAELYAESGFPVPTLNSKPGSPYMGIPLNRESTNKRKFLDDKKPNPAYDGDKQKHDALAAMSFVTKAFENVSVLKNIIAAFVSIGDRFGGQDIRKKTHMSPVQIYNALIEYMTIGSFQFKDSTSNNAHTALLVSMRTTDKDANYGNDPDANDMFKRGVNTDEMFVFVIKSMVAKILTVIGVYNMINRPIDRNALGYASATRWTLGGSDALPKIIPEALELYVRLPLLAEFYRETFKFSEETPVLSMVPHMDGTFQGLVELIFDRAKHIQYGTYSETDVKTMIEEINKIYMTFKGSKSMVQDVMQEFVAEVNRRYGILLTEERIRYRKQDEDRYSNMYENERGAQYNDRVDYDILPEEMQSGVGPSDSFITQGSKVSDPFGNDHKWVLRTSTHQQFIREIRMKMDNSLNAVWDNNSKASGDGLDHLKTLSFENLVKSRKEELKYARSAKEQFRVVQQAINGLGEFSMNSQERSLILFHETVVTGLNTMMSLFTMVKAFHSKIWGMANSIDNVHKFYNVDDPADFKDWDDATLTGGAPNEKGDTDYKRANPVALGATLTGYGLEVGKHHGERLALKSMDIGKAFIETLFGHCSSLDGLVELQMEVVDHPDNATWLKSKDLAAEDRPKSIAISIDHSKLYELVERELSFIKHALDKFRGLIPREIHKKYESFQDASGNSQIGSLYWLEKHFVHELLAGKVSGWTKDNLSNTNSKVRSIMSYIAQPWRVDIAGAALNGGTHYDQDDFTNILRNLASVGSNVGQEAVGNSNLMKVLLPLGGTPPLTPVPANKGNFYDHENLSRNNSANGAVSLFNRLTANYLNSCYDGQSEKIYVNTINNFANGAFSDAVMKGQTLKDLNGVNSNNVDSNVLADSIAILMKNLLVNKHPGKTFKHYLETDMAEIPLFIKESFRVNMPVYSKMFSLLIKKCEIIKNFVKACKNSEQKEHTAMLNNVIVGSQSLISCMRDVLEELADSPVFLETHKDSIKEYESLNGMKPMMPMSSLMYYLQNNSKALPGGSNDEEKMLYGTRGVLNGAHDLSKFPGMRDILQKHNETSESEYHMDEKSLANHVSDSLLVLRFVINAKHYAGYLTKHEMNASLGALAPISHVGVDLVGVQSIKLDIAAYSIGSNTTNPRPLSSILQITESSKQRDARRVLVETVEKTDKSIVRGSREDIRMMNIIDMNIVPINVHALMREMPLVNLFNYSYTFDAMVCNMMGLDNQYMIPDYNSDGTVKPGGQVSFANMLAKLPVREKAKKFMAYLLLHPYADVADDQFHDCFGRIVRGSTGIAGLGRPKFLGDELYNKALFGEIYTNEAYWDESGPNVGQPAGFARHKNLKEVVADHLLEALQKKSSIDINAVANKPALKELRALYTKIVIDNSTALTDANSGNLLLTQANLAFAGLVGWWRGPVKPTAAEWTQYAVDGRAKYETIYQKYDVNKPAHSGSDKLHYLHPTKDGRGEIVSVTVGNKTDLQALGKERFDTFYCRSLVWLTNIQRVLRLKLRQDLEWYDSRIVKDNMVTSADITEQYGNDAHSYSSRHYSN